MSRSIHTTRRTLKVLAKIAKANPAAKSGLADAFEEKHRKRRIKRAVRKERQPPKIEGALTPPEAVPIQIEDEGQPGVVHAVNREDLLAILKALPNTACEGIAGLRLALGKSYQEEVVISDPSSDHVCDPLTDRPGYLLFPGAWCGRVLGMFSRRTGLITIFAFVVREEECPLPAPALRFYLKLQALKTFVHEVAHHQDHSTRVRRGRWLADRKGNVENYAERMADLWSQTIVCPYLRQTYPREAEALLGWIGENGGAHLSLEQLAKDPPVTARDGFVLFWISSPADAFERWLSETPPNASPIEKQIAFAREIHYASLDFESLVILNRILQSVPAHLEALTVKVTALISLKHFDEALAILDCIQSDHPNHERAWAARCQIFERQKDWELLLSASQQWTAQMPLESENLGTPFAFQAVAFCALDRIPEMEAAIESACQSPTERKGFLRRILKRAGKFSE